MSEIATASESQRRIFRTSRRTLETPLGGGASAGALNNYGSMDVAIVSSPLRIEEQP